MITDDGDMNYHLITSINDSTRIRFNFNGGEAAGRPFPTVKNTPIDFGTFDDDISKQL